MIMWPLYLTWALIIIAVIGKIILPDDKEKEKEQREKFLQDIRAIIRDELERNKNEG